MALRVVQKWMRMLVLGGGLWGGRGGAQSPELLEAVRLHRPGAAVQAKSAVP